MVVGVLTLRLIIAEAHSLKDKRHCLRSIRDRLRTGFNVSVAEVDCQDVWQTAVLGVCAIGSDRSYVEGLLDSVVALVRSSRQVVLAKAEKEFV
jgi:hypothetical protein